VIWNDGVEKRATGGAYSEQWGTARCHSHSLGCITVARKGETLVS